MTTDLAAQVAAWVARTLAAEPPPVGVTTEIVAAATGAGPAAAEAEAADQRGLQAALVALTQEVRLEGRAFARLEAALGAGAGAGGPDRREVERQVEERLRGEHVGVLCDLRDRLVRSRAGAEAGLADLERAAASGWWRLLGGGPLRHAVAAVRSLVKGATLGLEGLDAALAAAGVTEVRCLGVPFDPETMRVIDVEARAGVVDGTVLEVFRPGYRRADRVLRPAEVKVARREKARA
jgi:molecular chaperone GrpE